MTNIDAVDAKIIEILQAVSSASNTEIAERLGLSEATVRRRRAHLEEEDVIRVVAVANPFKLGYHVLAIVGIQVEGNRLAEVEASLHAMPEIHFLGVTLSRYDLIVEAWFKSNDELLRFVTDKLNAIGGVLRAETFQIMRLSKYTNEWGTAP